MPQLGSNAAASAASDSDQAASPRSSHRRPHPASPASDDPARLVSPASFKRPRTSSPATDDDTAASSPIVTMTDANDDDDSREVDEMRSLRLTESAKRIDLPPPPGYGEAMGQTISVHSPGGVVDSPPDEAKLVKDHNFKPLVEKERWFLVERDWYKRWQARTADHNAPAVGPLTSRSLLEDARDASTLRANLNEGIDFQLLHSESHRVLSARYGTDEPVVSRSVIALPGSGELRLEMYPPTFHLFEIREAGCDALPSDRKPATTRLSVVTPIVSLKMFAWQKMHAGAPLKKNVRFWRLPEARDEAGIAAGEMAAAVAAGAELIDAGEEDLDDSKASITLGTLQLDQPNEALAVEFRRSDGTWLVDAGGKEIPAAPSAKGVFAQSGGDFFAQKLGKSPAVASISSSMDPIASSSRLTRSQTASGRSARNKGVTGLYNLGNTCFLAAAVQCMSNTAELKEYFTTGTYRSEINTVNPLGMRGEMAEAFGELLNQLWSGTQPAVHPRHFKSVLSRHSPQFIGYAQQDSQELLAFLLDGLHEDLNRIKKKPYVEAPDWEGGDLRDMVVFAKRQWEIYKMRNDSVIVDLFQGQYKSTLVCPVCAKVSIKFDPFMYLTLPIPNRKKKLLKVYYVPYDVTRGTTAVEMQVDSDTTIAKVKKQLGEWFDVEPKKIFSAEVWQHGLYRTYSDYDSVIDIAKDDNVYFWELPVDVTFDNKTPAAMFHDDPASLEARSPRASEENSDAILPVFSLTRPTKGFAGMRRLDGFGIPIMVVIPAAEVGDASSVEKHVRARYERYVAAERAAALESVTDETQPQQEQPATDTATTDSVAEITNDGETVRMVPDKAKRGLSLHFALRSRDNQIPLKLDSTDYAEELHSRKARLEGSDPKLTWPVVYTGGGIVAVWEPEAYDAVFAGDGQDRSNVWGKTETFVSPELAAQRQEPTAAPRKRLTIDDCLDEFCREEQLGEEDPWYCPQCKEFRQASKKFDLWKAPDILVVHLKRFSAGRMARDKIGDDIDFPIEGLDLEARVQGAQAVQVLAEAGEEIPTAIDMASSVGSLGDLNDDAVASDKPIYDLYAVDNHYGGLGGGHYTAYAKNPDTGKWYYFDDSSVREVRAEEEVKGPAAYLLFYRRRTTRPIGGKSRERFEEAAASRQPSDEGHGMERDGDGEGDAADTTNDDAASAAGSLDCAPDNSTPDMSPRASSLGDGDNDDIDFSLSTDRRSDASL